MTPTASSPSLLLSTTTASSATTPLATAAQAAPDAGLSGFELLLGAMQQLQQGLPPATVAGDAQGHAAAADNETGGNAFPLLGMLLPVSGLSGKSADLDNMGEMKSADGDLKSEKGEADVDADFLLFNVMQPATALVSNNPSVAGDPNSPQKGDFAALSSADDLAAQVAAASSANVAVGKEDGSARADRSGALSLKLGSAELGITSADTANANTVATKASAADINALGQAAIDVSAESDFDVLVKQFESPSSPQLNGAPSGVGESTSVHHASRTYSNAMNSNAAIPVPVGSDGWSDAVADKVMWFSANKISSAEIHLNPPDLGPLQVRVSTQQDQASVVFTSQHAAVRDALDQALPRLRDMMGSQGMQLLDVSVGGQTAQQQQQQFARNESQQNGGQLAGFAGDDAAEAKAANITNINTARIARAGVDAYA